VVSTATAQRIGAVFTRQAIEFRRSPHRWFDLIAPAVDTLLIATIGVLAVREGASAEAGVPYLLVGVLLFHVLWQAELGIALGFLDETWSRNILNLMVTPLREWEFVTAAAAVGMAKVVAAIVVVAATGVALYAVDVGDTVLGVLPVIALLIVQGWFLAFVCIGCVLRFGSGAEILAWILAFVIWPFSGVFYPVDALPGALQPVAWALPTTHAFVAAREVIGGGALPWDDVARSAALTAITGALTTWFLLRMLARFRREGYVTRYS
jgi:ABC-2 type transport system permease protein